MLLDGKTIVFKGRFKQFKTKSMHSLLRHSGALIKTNISLSTHLVILGVTSNDVHEQNARKKGADVLYESEFLERVPLFLEIDERWERLRHLLSQVEDETTWFELCQFMSFWPQEDELTLALEYADQHLAGVDDELRKVPVGWMRQILEGQHQERILIARSGHFQTRWDYRYKTIPLKEKEIHALANAPDFSVLKSVHIDSCDLDYDGFKTLCASPYLAGVEALHLYRNELSPRALEFLDDCVAFDSLHTLTFMGASGAERSLEPFPMRLLAESPVFKNLEVLHLSDLVFSEEEMETLESSTQLSDLRHLRIESVGSFSGECADALARASSIEALDTFTLTNSDLGWEGLRALMEAPFMRSVETLSLKFSNLGDDLEQLAQIPWQCLKHLNISGCSLSDHSLSRWGEFEHFSMLEELIMEYSEYTEEGIRAIVSTPYSRCLRRFEFKTYSIGLGAYRAIADSPYMTQIEHLGGHYESSLSREAAQILVASPHLPIAYRMRWPEQWAELNGLISSKQLLQLALSGAFDLLQDALQKGSDPAEIHIQQWSKSGLKRMLTESNWPCFELLVQHGMPVEPQPDAYRRPFLTTLLEHQDILDALDDPVVWIRRFLELGVDPSNTDMNECSPLHYAAYSGLAECVQVLLEAGASVDTICTRSFYHMGTPLHCAARSPSEAALDVLNLLLDAGSDPFVLDCNGRMPVHTTWNASLGWQPYSPYERMPESNFESMELLLDAMGDNAVNIPDAKGRPTLFYALRVGTLEQIQDVLAKGADPNTRIPRTHERPLHAAWSYNKSQAIPLLLEAGADPHARKKKSKTLLLHVASGWRENVELLQVLLDAGMDIELSDPFGNTPLLCAVKSEVAVHVAMLLEAGANVHTPNADGLTPLLAAVALTSIDKHSSWTRQYEDIIPLLIAAGADPDKAIGKAFKWSGVVFQEGDSPASIASDEVYPLLKSV